MPNKNYIRGRRKEYKIMKEERDKGRLVIRSAGSHSPIDIISIDIEKKVIRLIQSKNYDMSNNQIKALYNENIGLNGVFSCWFEVK